jgi:hypothetical protein
MYIENTTQRAIRAEHDYVQMPINRGAVDVEVRRFEVVK